MKCVVRIVDTIERARSVLAAIERLLRQAGCSERDRFHVHLATEEALVNAFTHGNKHDPGKCVAIRLYGDEARVWIEIEDEGSGFDVSFVPDPTTEEGVKKPNGRGILLMKGCMDSVQFLRGGRCVVMEKRCSAHSPNSAENGRRL